MPSRIGGLFYLIVFFAGAGAFGAERPLPPKQATIPRQERTPAKLGCQEITLTIGDPAGVIKPLTGVNAGPAPSGEAGNADLTDAYHRIGIRQVRVHDYYGPLDMSAMYPSLDADPELPDSYDFAASDRMMNIIVRGGFQPYFRIGDSWNNVRLPKTDRQQANFIRAAVNVVRHYTEGKWNGMRVPIACLEIWNEPDIKQFWPDDYAKFVPLYVPMYKALRSAFPSLKIGGPGFALVSYKFPDQRGRITEFIRAMKEAGIVPDFLSWHMYSNDPLEYAEATAFYRAQLDRQGFAKTALHLTEWNTDASGDGRDLRMGSLGASRLTAAWIALQEAGLDEAYFYRGNDTSPRLPTFYGMFFADGREKAIARAFKLWVETAKCGRKLAVTTGLPQLDAPLLPAGPAEFKPVWFLAGSAGEGPAVIRVLITSAQQVTCRIQFARADLNGVKWQVSATLLSGPRGEPINVQLQAPSLLLKDNDVALLRFERPPASP